ncbi:type VI secretion system baseplate subunit TssF [uncultured Sulfitobacter sp.]|uniref:type VI secretion system baseplate subunit TssF n=1 Tax=uncultured Sulfitobacter sp. TaxID=191468 RepID=UPI0030DA4856|tara:strand:+ start:22213 stop:24012 length:1800 start_codon:yes stop_codon:yes gene_type:complete
MEQILQHYETELDYMRRAFQEFEKSYPQKAKSLGISAGRSSDPDVQRLADSLALHAARLSKRLDDTLPETALDLIRILAPTFLLGAPSYTAVKLDPGTDALAEKTVLAAGTEMPVTIKGDRPSCRFSTARDVTLHPITVKSVRLERAPFRFSAPESLVGCETAICVTLASLDAGQPLAEVGINALELYVSAEGARKQRLIDVLSGEVFGVGYGETGAERSTKSVTNFLSSDSFALSMTEETRTFLPREKTEMEALARLRDFLAYPDKAAFFTLSDTDKSFAKHEGSEVELRFFLSNQGAQQIKELSDGDLSVNVVPTLNLYLDQSRPARYDFTRLQVPVKPETSADMDVDCLQIRSVRKLTSEGEQLLPCITSGQRRDTGGVPVWQERYQTGEFDAARREISFSTFEGQGSDPEPLDFVASMYCSNGRAAFAPRPGTQVFFNSDALAECPFYLIDEPSAPIAPDVKIDRLWDVLSMIDGNFATIFDSSSPSERLRETLHLSAPSGYADAANAIWDVKVTQSIAPIRVGRNMLLSAGSQIEVVLDVDALPFARHVFANALHFFFAAMISYDRFFQLKLRERGKEKPFKVFPRQHGGQICG